MSTLIEVEEYCQLLAMVFHHKSLRFILVRAYVEFLEKIAGRQFSSK